MLHNANITDIVLRKMVGQKRRSVIYTKVPPYLIVNLDFSRIRRIFVEIMMFIPSHLTLRYFMINLCRITWRNYALSINFFDTN